MGHLNVSFDCSVSRLFTSTAWQITKEMKVTFKGTSVSHHKKQNKKSRVITGRSRHDSYSEPQVISTVQSSKFILTGHHHQHNQSISSSRVSTETLESLCQLELDSTKPHGQFCLLVSTFLSLSLINTIPLGKLSVQTLWNECEVHDLSYTVQGAYCIRDVSAVYSLKYWAMNGDTQIESLSQPQNTVHTPRSVTIS